jgi:hypothetical protein
VGVVTGVGICVLTVVVVVVVVLEGCVAVAAALGPPTRGGAGMIPGVVAGAPDAVAAPLPLGWLGSTGRSVGLEVIEMLPALRSFSLYEPS